MAFSPLSLARPVPARAVHLHIIPRPINLTQSRSILQLLEQHFGEVEFYKNLKYERLARPTAALVIFREEVAARKLVQAKALLITMSREGRQMGFVTGRDQGGNAASINHKTSPEKGLDEEETQEDDSASAEAVEEELASSKSSFSARQWQQQQNQRRASTTKSNSPGMPFDPPPDVDDDSTAVEFQILVNKSTYSHRDHINTNPYSGPFAVDTKSAIQEDLARRVPLVGLSDINLKKMEKPWRVVAWQRKREMETRRPLQEMFEQGRKERLKGQQKAAD